MRVIAKNKNNDLYMDSRGNLAISTELKACIEACETKVSTMLGEMIFFTEQGIPNFELIWNGNPNFLQAQMAIRRAILSVENVTDILELDTFSNDNTFSYTAIIQTTFGVGRITNGL